MRTKREMLHNLSLVAALTLASLMTAGVTYAEDPKKPNILIIWGDDIGYWNVSAYNQGMMGYKTPNIDRIAKEGALFTDWYGQQSCTAGRSCFITGQSIRRTIPGFFQRIPAEPEARQLFARRRAAKFAERSESHRRLTEVEHEQTGVNGENSLFPYTAFR